MVILYMKSELIEIENFIARQTWTFAKTMPHSPHEYVVKTKLSAADQSDFERFVLFIRAHGTPKKFKKAKYVHFDLDGWSYWTMGAPLEITTIINRHRLGFYDLLADRYDRIFSGADALVENMRLLELFAGHLRGEVLDVGCGTGLLLDMNPHSRLCYTGVDPSAKMLARLKQKYPRARAVETTFEDFRTKERFDFLCSLFGAFSYINPAAHERIKDLLAPGGKYFLMFYKPRYFPVLYQKTGICFSHYVTDPERVKNTFDRVFEYSNYIVATNIENCD